MTLDAWERFHSWMNDEKIDEETKNELQSIRANDEEVYDRFYKTLEFGTGGLRGKIGAGANRLNIYTIRLASQAFANVLIKKGRSSQGVVIAYDSRNWSREFAHEAAKVMIGNGIPVHIFDDIAPTPMLSFAVRHIGAGAGIMITASHNPPEYNGFKAFDEKGVQLLDDLALAVSDQMKTLSLSDVRVESQPDVHPLWHVLGEETYQAYFQAVNELEVISAGEKEIKILYTPLHGTGRNLVPRLLELARFVNVDCVEEQMIADGNFPTVTSPNPEDAESFSLAFKKAKDGIYDLILATDPDGDRVGIAVWNGERYVLLSGNQVGVLLTDYLLTIKAKEDLSDSVVIKTVVSTEMIEPIAKKYGVSVENTLIGFKYIGDRIGRLEQEGKRFLFGFEESYGYLAGTFIRDKDAVLACLLIAEMANFYKNNGLNLEERIYELFEEHGYYLETLRSFNFGSSSESEKSKNILAYLLERSLTEIAGKKIRFVRNFAVGEEHDLLTDQVRRMDFPRENIVQWETVEGDRITLRPSGTEPKMKRYVGVVATEQSEAESKLVAFEEHIDSLVFEGLNQ